MTERENDRPVYPPTITIIPWCCRHKWTLGYIATVVTLLLVLRLTTLLLGWP